MATPLGLARGPVTVQRGSDGAVSLKALPGPYVPRSVLCTSQKKKGEGKHEH